MSRTQCGEMRYRFKEATNRPDMIFKNFFGFSWQPVHAMDKVAELEKIELSTETSHCSGVKKTHAALRNALALHSVLPQCTEAGLQSPAGFALVTFSSRRAHGSLIESSLQRDRMFLHSCDVSGIKVID